MTYSASYPSEDGDLAVLAGIVGCVESFDEAIRAAQIGQIRAFAQAGQLAQKQSRGASARVKAHEMALRSIAAEIAGVLRVTDRTVQHRIDQAREIVEEYPATLTAWEVGSITRGHVNVIVDTGRILPADARAEFEAAAITRCERDTPNRVRHGLEILAQRMHPRSFTERHQEAAAERCVRVFPTRDGMSELIATLPTVLAEGIHDRLTREARAIIDARNLAGRTGGDARDLDVAGDGEPGRTGDAADASNDANANDFTGDTRTIDQVRADVFADTLLAGTPTIDPTRGDVIPGGLGAIRAHVQIVVPVLTLLGSDDGPVDLAGASPIDAATARTLTGCAPSLSRLLTHPVTGTVLEVDRYRPSKEMQRLLRGRDQHCRFPGCRAPAIRCELDHTIDHHLGGRTACSNLACLCQRHHSMKQFTPWKVRQHEGGVLEWTSPLGRTHREDTPTPPVCFSPADGPPPRTTAPPPGCEPAPF